MRPFGRFLPSHILVTIGLAATISWGLVDNPPGDHDTRGFAEIAIQPTSLELSVVQGESADTTFLVANEGSGLLIVYSIEDDADWLGEDPSSFEVTAGLAQVVTVTADASNLSPGTYSQSISIESNDEDESTLVVPIAVTVTEPAGTNGPHTNKPDGMWLALPTPNPFASSTAIRFRLPSDRAVRLQVFDVRGDRIAILHDGVLASGVHTARWNGMTSEGIAASAGIYFARLEAGEHVRVVPLLRLQ